MDNLQRILLGVCVALAFAASPHPAAAQMVGPAGAGPKTSGAVGAVGDAHRGRSIAAAHCASCHGADGNNDHAQDPKLAGLDPAYLYRQLWAFKRGERQSAVMQGVVAPLTDADLADVSAYYGDQTVRPDPVTDPAAARSGEQIYYAGRPSCAMCHQGGGMPRMGMMGGGNAPRLDGQHALYTLQQLDAFASGQRQGTVMNRIAAQLSESERRAVAEYLAGIR